MKRLISFVSGLMLLGSTLAVAGPATAAQTLEGADAPVSIATASAGGNTESFAVIGDIGLSEGDTVTDKDLQKVGLDLKTAKAASIRDMPLGVAAASNSPVSHTWKDKKGKTTTIRKNIVEKLNTKHNVSWQVARTTTMYPKSWKYGVRTKTDAEYRTPVNEVKCSGFLGWRKCKVVNTVTVFARVDFRTNTSDKKPYGVVTTFCEGMVKCPSYVRNAANV